LAGEVGTLAGEDAALAGEVGTLAGEVGTLAGEDATLAGEVGTLAGEVGALAPLRARIGLALGPARLRRLPEPQRRARPIAATVTRPDAPHACEAAPFRARSEEPGKGGHVPTHGGRAGWAVGFVACVGISALPAREARAAPTLVPPSLIAETPEPAVAPYVDRGMLYGAGQGGFSIRLRAATDTYDGMAADAALNLAFGLTSHLTFETSLGTMALAPRIRYRSPNVGLWYGLVDTPSFELDMTTHLGINVDGRSAFSQVEPGFVAILRAEDAVRVDVGAYVPVPLDGGARGVGFRMPLTIAAQITPDVHFAVGSGLTFESLGVGADRTSVPLELSLGCTMPLGEGGYMMLTPSVSWPHFLSVQTGDQAPSGPGPMIVALTLGVVTPP